jgi:hypothetical protein
MTTLIDIDDVRPTEHRFAFTTALISLLLAGGTVPAVLMLIAQA